MKISIILISAIKRVVFCDSWTEVNNLEQRVHWPEQVELGFDLNTISLFNFLFNLYAFILYLLGAIIVERWNRISDEQRNWKNYGDRQKLYFVA
jgi:hypothetical protein